MNKGNLVNWTTSQWNLTNTVAAKLNTEDICRLPKPKNVVMSENRNMSALKLLCNALGGQIAVARNEVVQEQLILEYLRVLPQVPVGVRGVQSKVSKYRNE
jgi:hypothetical protein